jgi:hypothetical protein
MQSGMQTAPAQISQKKWVLWTGRAISVVPVFLILIGVATAVFQPKVVADGMARFGYAPDRIPIVLTLELLAVVLYVIPQTAVFGAVFMTAYLGGAVATHVRIHDPGWPLAVVAAVCAWIGLYLRDERLRPLVPLRRLH